MGITEIDKETGEFRHKCPTFALKCRACGPEFEFVGTYDEADAITCEACGAPNVETLYMTFPTDGPGFQEGYSADFLRGGCANRKGGGMR